MSTDLPNIPTLSPELVKALDVRFPERCPDPKWSDREVWIAVGKREVVRFLIEQKRRQDHANLEGTTIPNV